jgi:hypothetical protein
VYDQFNLPFIRPDLLQNIQRIPLPFPGPIPMPSGFTAPAEADQPDRPAELAGATEEPVVLTGETVATSVSTSSAAAFREDAPAADPDRVYLNVEEIRAEGTPATPYEVYVNLPDDDETTDDHYQVGLVSLFGAAEASDPESDHPEGLKYTFDITDLYKAMKEAGVWNDDVKVTFKPVRVEMPEGASAAFIDAEPQPEPPVTIGRVSVFYQ